MRLDDLIFRWVEKPAAWWQFWLPQSGAAGGAIVTVILSVLLFGLPYFILVTR